MSQCARYLIYYQGVNARAMDRLPELEEFTILASVFNARYQARYYALHQHAPDFVFALLCGDWEHCDKLRAEAEGLLSVGSRLGLLGNHMRGQMRCGRDAFLSAYAELEVAAFLDQRGLVITPAPQGRTVHIGDMEIVAEVKAVFDRAFEAGENTVISGVVRYAEPLFDEFDESALVRFTVRQPGTINRRHLQGWLRGVFAERRSSGQDAMYVYHGRNGLELEMHVMPTSGQDHPAMMTLSVGDNHPASDYMRASVESACEQLPNDGRPTLVVVRPHLSLVAGEQQLLDSLLGRRQWSINLKTRASVTTYPWDGVFSPAQRTRLSAVALLDINGVRPDPHRMLVVHNPWTRMRLDPTLLSLPDVRQLVPLADGNMKWFPDDEEQAGLTR